MMFWYGAACVLILYLFIRRGLQEQKAETKLDEIHSAVTGPPKARLLRCERCQHEVPPWFAERFGNELICYADTEGKPYPEPDENEDDYVARWLASLRRDWIAEKAVAVVEFVQQGHGGPGWYYWDEDYTDEGSVGPFGSCHEAEAHAREADYQIASAAQPSVLG